MSDSDGSFDDYDDYGDYDDYDDQDDGYDDDDGGFEEYDGEEAVQDVVEEEIETVEQIDHIEEEEEIEHCDIYEQVLDVHDDIDELSVPDRPDEDDGDQYAPYDDSESGEEEEGNEDIRGYDDDDDDEAEDDFSDHFQPIHAHLYEDREEEEEEFETEDVRGQDVQDRLVEELLGLHTQDSEEENYHVNGANLSEPYWEKDTERDPAQIRTSSTSSARDPAAYGWKYEGSNARSGVEFYRREDGTKMDYYPNTGTVKTSMKHPTQGPTQMFRRHLTDEEFARVCENPREHTGKGYQYAKNDPSKKS